MKDKLAFHNDIHITQSGNIVQYSSSNNISTPTKVTVESENTIGEIASWGINNTYPQDHLKLVRQNGMTLSGLRALRKSHYGSGLTLITETFTQEEENKPSKRIITPKSLLQYPDINTFFKNSRMHDFLQTTIADLEYFSMAFPEYILSADYKKIKRVYRQQTANCRLEVMNDKGFIPRVWVSHKWDENVTLKSKYAKDIPLIALHWTAEEVKAYCKKNKIRNFCRPVYYPMLNEGYYPFTDWHSAKKWIELSNSIPDFKKKMFENQANITFHIEISEDYFARKYKNDWQENFSIDEKNQIRDDFHKELDEKINGQKNAGVSITSIMYLDDNGKPEPSVKITPIDNKYKEGMYLPEASAANSEILSAMGLDVSLIGSGIPGGKILNGSGSDKRVAWEILQAMMKSNREYTTEIFDFVKEYNGWPEEVFAVFEDTNITTLDKNPTGTQNTVNS